MKLRQDDNVIISNTQNQRAFTIAATAKAFKILSDSLYSRKIEAIVRELSCNAYDSHVQAGTSRPFEITLPTAWNPEFSVEDFGVGLDKDDVENIYTSYFTSTKTESNDVIGALGLGSKTPFSYTDSFNITARKNGKSYTYNAFINASGEPSVALLSESTTEEPNGVKISVPVRNCDFNQFRDDVLKVASWFVDLPVVHNLDREIDNSKAVKLDEEEFFWIQRGSYGNYTSDRIVAVMGNVAYVVDNVSSTFTEFTEGERAFLKQNNLYVKFNIGDLDVAASRETISFDEYTTETFINRIKTVISTFSESTQTTLDEMFDESKGPSAALAYIESNIGQWAYGLFNYANANLVFWKSRQVIPEIVNIFRHGYDDRIKNDKIFDSEYYSSTSSWRKVSKRYTHHSSTTFDNLTYYENFFFIEKSGNVGKSNVARKLLEGNKGVVFFLNNVLSDAQKVALRETIGVDKVNFIDFTTYRNQLKAIAKAERDAQRALMITDGYVAPKADKPAKPRIEKTKIRAALFKVIVSDEYKVSYERLDNKREFDLSIFDEIDSSEIRYVTIYRNRLFKEYDVSIEDNYEEFDVGVMMAAIHKVKYLIVQFANDSNRNVKMLKPLNIMPFECNFEKIDTSLVSMLFIRLGYSNKVNNIGGLCSSNPKINEMVNRRCSDKLMSSLEFITKDGVNITFKNNFEYKYKLNRCRSFAERCLTRLSVELDVVLKSIFDEFPLLERIRNSYQFEESDVNHYIDAVNAMKKLELIEQS